MERSRTSPSQKDEDSAGVLNENFVKPVPGHVREVRKYLQRAKKEGKQIHDTVVAHGSPRLTHHIP